MLDDMFYDLEDEDTEPDIPPVAIKPVMNMSLLDSLLGGTVACPTPPTEEDAVSEEIESEEDAVSMEKCEESTEVSVEKCEDLGTENIEKCEDLSTENIEKCEETPEKPLEKCKEHIETPITQEIATPAETVSTEGTLMGFETEGDTEGTAYDSQVVSATPSTSGVEYPFLMLETPILAQHKLIALRSMLVSYIKDNGVQMYHVYLKHNGSVLKVGITTSFSLRAILESNVFSGFSKYIKLDKATRIEGDLMFALCGVAE